MHEKHPHAKNFEQYSLQDVTARVRHELRELCGRTDTTASLPRGLYARLEGFESSYTTYVDNGCRGGWEESHQATLGRNLVKITNVFHSANQPRLTLDTTSTGERTGVVELQLSDIDSIDFFSGDPETSDDFDADIKQRLQRGAFSRASSESLTDDPARPIAVRAHYPLEHPISLRNRYESYYSPGSQAALDTHFHSVETVVSDGATLARVVIQDSDLPADITATQWVPLDQLEFYQAELSKRSAHDARLAAAATKLLELGEGYGALNELLRDPGHGTIYNLPYNPRAAGRYAAPFVLGRLARLDTISGITIPTLDEHGFYQPHLRARTVVPHDNWPWVVNTESGLATPLVYPANLEEPSSLTRPVEEFLTEPERFDLSSPNA